jgi:DNA invertase Pin-like site-specific DNA recombinase
MGLTSSLARENPKIDTRKETRAAIYVRVSTDEQTTANQERELRQIAEGQGWTVVEVYRDAGISGAKGRDERPAFDALCKGCHSTTLRHDHGVVG